MRKKLAITLLIAILTTMMSFCVLAAEVENHYDVMLISENEEKATDLLSPAPISNTTNDLVAPSPLADTIKVQLDGEIIDFTDENGNVVNPKMMNNRTMVPMRKIFEEFGMQVEWNASSKTITAMNEEKIITLAIDGLKATVETKTSGDNLMEEIELDAAPVILDNRTMVPVRFIAESLEKQVGWDPNERTVIIIDFDKLVKDFEKNTPQLKKLMELELEPVESVKTTSTISGKVVYQDAEEKANNETVSVTGNLTLNMNQEKEIEMALDLKFTGKGTIYNSIKQAGYETMKFAMVMADSHTYVMMKQNGEEIWMDLGDSFHIDEFSNLSLSKTSPKTYEEYAEIMKEALGELDVSTYQTLQQSIQLIEFMFADDNFKITQSGNTQTIQYSFDLKDLLTSFDEVIASQPEELEALTMKMDIIEKIKSKKVDSAKITFEMAMEEPETKETMEIDFTLDMKYNSINKNFDITLPDVETVPLYQL